jgi:hypothetical protein
MYQIFILSTGIKCPGTFSGVVREGTFIEPIKNSRFTVKCKV